MSRLRNGVLKFLAVLIVGVAVATSLAGVSFSMAFGQKAALRRSSQQKGAGMPRRSPVAKS